MPAKDLTKYLKSAWPEKEGERKERREEGREEGREEEGKKKNGFLIML